MTGNVDQSTIESFGDEWSRHRQADLGTDELGRMFEAYFHIFPWEKLPENATGFDMGVGSGRWARFVAPRVGHLHAIDAAKAALAVARSNLEGQDNITFHHATTDTVPPKCCEL